MYDATVFEKIKTLVPSNRGELEITDVNNAYIREGTMTFSYLDGWWTDAGTFESLLRAANLVAQSVRTAAPESQTSDTAVEGGRANLMAGERTAKPAADRALGRPGVDAAGVSKGPRPNHQFPYLRRSDRGRAHRSRCACFPTTADIFSKLQRMGRGLAAEFPAATTQVSAALNHPGAIKAFHYHLHQTDCWNPVTRLVAGGSGGPADRDLPRSGSATPCTSARCGPGRCWFRRV